MITSAHAFLRRPTPLVSLFVLPFLLGVVPHSAQAADKADTASVLEWLNSLDLPDPAQGVLVRVRLPNLPRFVLRDPAHAEETLLPAPGAVEGLPDSKHLDVMALLVERDANRVELVLADFTLLQFIRHDDELHEVAGPVVLGQASIEETDLDHYCEKLLVNLQAAPQLEYSSTFRWIMAEHEVVWAAWLCVGPHMLERRDELLAEAHRLANTPYWRYSELLKNMQSMLALHFQQRWFHELADPAVPRAELLRQCEWYLAGFPTEGAGWEPFARFYEERRDVLKRMIAEDARPRAPVDEQNTDAVVLELLHQLRDAHCHGRSIGMASGCDTTIFSDKEGIPSQLVAFGPRAIPLLIEAVDDVALTRYVCYWYRESRVTDERKVGDCAFEIIAEIVGSREFYKQFPEYFELTTEERRQLQNDLRKWWAARESDRAVESG